MAENKDVFAYNNLNAEELDIVEKLIVLERLARLDTILLCLAVTGVRHEEALSMHPNMPLRTTDIFVASYQRSGTTLTQELVWLLANDLDYERAAAVPLTQRYPFLEIAMFYDITPTQNMSTTLEQMQLMQHYTYKEWSTPATETLAQMPSPRFVKTHLPMSLLPPTLVDTAKVVYIARDPRDVIVSSFHHAKLFKVIKPSVDFKLMWDIFRKDLYTLTPYFEHVKEAWSLRHHPNMLFLFYEDLSKDKQGSIRRVANFLGKELTQEQMERLCDHLSIESFKKNKSLNFEDMKSTGILDEKESFIRKGKSGGWHEYFDDEMKAEAEQWIADNLRDTDLRFPSMTNK